ncbi:hypothetical protein [Rhizobium laguerreae]|uniref:hypothetical protein n=1 Tax=Rhizobium laguerreae TaxID=1076926 RepID=UPI001C8FB7F0|nr:hypothetical protein [Rhizobium laguerreae]
MNHDKEIARLTAVTIKTAIGPTIILGSGNYFDYVDPDGSEITIEDVAYGIGYEGRFAGQCYSRILGRRAFYSSGQHSVLMSYAVDRGLEMEALMHEAGEAVCGDVTGPLKSLSPDYKAIEKNCERSILSKFGIEMKHKLEIKTADVRMFVTERRDLTAWNGEDWSVDGGGGVAPYEFRIIPWTPDDSAQAFLDRYAELTQPNFRSALLDRFCAEAGISNCRHSLEGSITQRRSLRVHCP